MSLRNTTFPAPGTNALCRLRRVSKTRHDWFIRVFAPAQAKDLRLPENEERRTPCYSKIPRFEPCLRGYPIDSKKSQISRFASGAASAMAPPMRGFSCPLPPGQWWPWPAIITD